MQAAGSKSQRAASKNFDVMQPAVKDLRIRRSSNYVWVDSSSIIHEAFLSAIWCCAPKLDAGDV